MLYLDVDGPLIDDNTVAFFAWANVELGLPWDYGFFLQTGDWQAATLMSKSRLDVLFHQFVSSEHFPGETPTPGASHHLPRLHGREKKVITTRPHSLRASTQEFLAQHFSPIFSSYYWGVLDKAKVLKTAGSCFFVDDNILLAGKAAQHKHVCAILFISRWPRLIKKTDGLVILDAESMIAERMSDEEWARACNAAWQQIGDIVSLPASVTA